jgi:4-methyl-5(b-hydroxyethyl)-thiazole monophosphate biosynthesis
MSMKRVLLLIPEGAELLETAAFFDVLGWASAEGSEPIEVVTAGLEPEIRSAFGMRIVPDRQLADVDVLDFDALAVPGGFEEYGFYRHAYSDDVSQLIRAFDMGDKPIASVCVGALPLAHSGVLRGRRATTYHLSDGKRRRQLAAFDVEVVDEAVVRDRNIVTSTSPATAVEVALTLVEALTDRDNAAKIRHLMGFEIADAGGGACR